MPRIFDNIELALRDTLCLSELGLLLRRQF